MMRENTAIRHSKLAEDYRKMINKRNAQGVPVYSLEYIFSELSIKYYYSKKTVEKIIRTPEPSASAQMGLGF